MTRNAITKSHIWGREGLQAEKKVAPKLSCRLGGRQVSKCRDIRKGNAGIDVGFGGSFSSFEKTSPVLNLRCEGEMEGRLQREPMEQ